jgi:phospholipid/cholesterol/gamma-HCH transport system ATP-binding protein
MIEVRGLEVGFSGKVVLEDFSLTVKDGETLALLGQSGEGKTVFLKALVGLIRPTKGEIVIDGVSLTDASRRTLFDVRRKFGFVFQHSALFDSLTVLENVLLPLREKGIKGKRAREMAEEALKVVDMLPFLDKFPAELSGGMKKRVAIARALVIRPKYILYDEPTTGLDPLIADKINDLMIQVKEKTGATGIVVTHDLRSAIKVSDRIALLAGGKIVLEAASYEILKVDNPLLKQFLMSSGLYIR